LEKFVGKSFDLFYAGLLNRIMFIKLTAACILKGTFLSDESINNYSNNIILFTADKRSCLVTLFTK
jgi:hypothetical protein